MTDKKTNRRKLLKSIAAGSGAVVAGKSLPESWSKPVVDAVLLPVHAETTDDTGNLPITTIAPTTTPSCCLIAETYCGLYTDALWVIEIAVATDGGIIVTIYPDGPLVLTDSIPCTGGSFEASSGGITVTGEVGCAATSIRGQITAVDFFATYEATIGGCDPN